ncbi:MAG: TAXI family TRAP transporter solute-binding subunit [Syntrophorhabdaceae bacterium]|nr:TAXI family TRAP transporter solute-binding subunit [Syntrophorhabdaceae bacterium]
MKIKNGGRNHRFFFWVLLAVLLVPAIALSAEKPTKLVISGGTAGGAWGAVTEGVAEALRTSLPGVAVSTTAGTDATNFMRIEKGSSDLVLGVASTALRAIGGKEPFKTKMVRIRAITTLFEEPFQFVILKSTGIKDLADIKSKKYPLRHSPNKKGNFMEIACEEVFKEYGFDYQAVKSYKGKIFFNSYSESINLLRSGSLDSLSGCSPVPTTAFQELSGTHDITILPLSEKVISAMNKEFGTVRMVIPRKAYKFLTADVPTIAAKNILACEADLPDDLVYKITKAIYEKRTFLSGIHVVLKGLNPRFMADTGGVPLHPGAQKFYREIGVLK